MMVPMVLIMKKKLNYADSGCSVHYDDEIGDDKDDDCNCGCGDAGGGGDCDDDGDVGGQGILRDRQPAPETANYWPSPLFTSSPL